MQMFLWVLWAILANYGTGQSWEALMCRGPHSLQLASVGRVLWDQALSPIGSALAGQSASELNWLQYAQLVSKENWRISCCAKPTCLVSGVLVSRETNFPLKPITLFLFLTHILIPRPYFCLWKPCHYLEDVLKPHLAVRPSFLWSHKALKRWTETCTTSSFPSLTMPPVGALPHPPHQNSREREPWSPHLLGSTNSSYTTFRRCSQFTFA